MSKKKTYETDEIKIHWNPEICEHSANCVKGAPKVFKPGEKPWVKVNAESVENLAKTIDTCPSGALSYELKTAKNDKSISIEDEITEISVDKLRPTRLKGNFKIMDREGNVLLENKKVAALCACGQTKHWPLCDGMHKTLPENQ